MYLQITYKLLSVRWKLQTWWQTDTTSLRPTKYLINALLPEHNKKQQE